MKSRKLALYGLLTALAMILSYVEALIPFSFAVPGIKIGLANTVTVFALYKLMPKEALSISLVRVTLTAVLFGSAYSFMYSLAGALLSFISMLALKKSGRFSETGVSVAGGVSHNLGQILVAMAVFDTPGLIYYFPALCVSGTAAGVVIGAAAGIIAKRVKI